MSITVALGFGMSAASAFGQAARRRRLEREAQSKDEKEEVPDSTPARAAMILMPSSRVFGSAR